MMISNSCSRCSKVKIADAFLIYLQLESVLVIVALSECDNDMKALLLN